MSKFGEAFGVNLEAPYFNENRWVSPFNWWPEVRDKMHNPDKVHLHDVTLRDGEQTARIAFTVDEKIFLAQQLDKLGVHSIEPGLPATPEDKEVIKTLSSMGLRAKIVPLVRVKEEDVQATIDAKADGMLLEFGINPYLLKFVYKITPEQLIQQIIEFSKAGKEAGMYVEFMGWDAFRIPDENYLQNFFTTIAEQGAIDRITVADTFGMGHPLATYEFIKKMKKWTGKPIGFHIHNDYGMATADSIMAVSAGADMVHTSINGYGERAGNVSTEEMAMALQNLLDIDAGIDLKRLKQTSDIFTEIAKAPPARNKPIVGSGLFEIESGIVAHILRGMEKAGLGGDILFPFAPQVAGHDGYRVIAGRGSGVHSVLSFLEERGIEATEEQIGRIAGRIKQAGLMLKSGLSKSILEGIIVDEMAV